MPDSYLLPDEACRTMAEYRAAGLGDAVGAARRLGRRGVVDAVHNSGLRRRDHSAVSVSSVWAGLPEDDGPRYLVANGTDSEPGSFTDRTLLRTNPLAVIEGIVVGALAIGARDAFVAIRRSFEFEYEIVTAAIAEAELAGWLEDVSIKCVRTPDAYLVGDERALLECIDGREALPQRDTTSAPTAVETLETLVNVAAIAVNGHKWFRSMGTPVSPGNLLCTVTGDVRRHAVIEAELGRRLYDVLEEGGDGFLPSSPPKAVFSGVSSPVMTRSRLAAPMCWEGLAAVGARVGRAAFVVHGEHTDMFAVAHQIAAYLYLESCGLCPACKFGGGEVTAYLARLVAGSGSRRDLEALSGRITTVTDSARCDLAHRFHDVVSSIMWAFPGDASAVTSGTATPQVPTVLAPVVDIVDGRARYADEHPVRLTRW